MASTNSTNEHALIEQIVREVLARLGKLEVSAKPATDSGKSVVGELRVAAKVISLSELDGRLDGVQRLIVRRGAVITPAVRDLLRTKKIAIASDAASGKSAAAAKVKLAVAETKYDLASLVKGLEGHRVAAEQLQQNKLELVVAELSAAATRDQLGVLLTSQTAVAACLANRNRGVRAAVANRVADVVAAVATLGANLLVVDPAGKSLFELTQLVREFAQGGPRKGPKSLQ